jgi:hypothetical protein
MATDTWPVLLVAFVVVIPDTSGASTRRRYFQPTITIASHLQFQNVKEYRKQHGREIAGQPPDKYVEAFADGDIQSNPPATNEAGEKSSRTYNRNIDQMPAPT